ATAKLGILAEIRACAEVRRRVASFCSTEMYIVRHRSIVKVHNIWILLKIPFGIKQRAARNYLYLTELALSLELLPCACAEEDTRKARQAFSEFRQRPRNPPRSSCFKGDEFGFKQRSHALDRNKSFAGHDFALA